MVRGALREFSVANEFQCQLGRSGYSRQEMNYDQAKPPSAPSHTPFYFCAATAIDRAAVGEDAGLK
jgi:hypothetical protein